MNKVTQLLNIEYPIIQGAMAQISLAPLVGAVSNAGGLGIIASGGLSGEQLREEIRKTKAITSKPFGVNLMLMEKNIDEIIDVLIEEDVRIVTTGAGTPKPYMPKLKEHHFIVMPVIPSAKVAKKMEELGVDAVIAEGQEAGGHIGTLTTMPLTRQVAETVNIPVICAGGIADGHGIVAAYALGADGVQIGTRFLASHECPIPEAYKEKVLEATDTSTVVTGLRSGHPVRCIGNEMTKKYLQIEFSSGDVSELGDLSIGALTKAVQGDIENGSLMAGQIAGLINDIKSVDQIIQDLVKESKEVLANLTLF